MRQEKGTGSMTVTWNL